MFNRMKNWVYGVYDQARLSWKTSSTRWLKGIASTAAVGVIGTTGFLGYQHHVEKHTHEIYHIYVADERIGSVSSPKLVKSYIEEQQNELGQTYPNVVIEIEADDITYQSEKGYKLEPDDEGTLERLAGQLSYYAKGVELKVAGETIGIVKDEQTAENILAQIESKYVDSQDSSGEVSILSLDAGAERAADEPDVVIEEVSFVEEVELREVETNPESVQVNMKSLVQKLENAAEKRKTYVVEPGDCLSCIAAKLDIEQEVIVENNPEVQDGILKIGDELDVTIEEPLLSVKTVESFQKTLQMTYPIEYVDDDQLKKGLTETIQDGQNGLKRVKFQQTKVNGKLLEEEIVQVDVLKEPIPKVIKRGTKVIPGEGTGTFRWPVKSAKVSSHYGPRWGTIHKGIDLTSRNRNIYAADHGTVSKATSNKGYGNYIVVNHNNGYETLYAHLSEIKVKKGERVEKGQVIGIMGSTGHSTGVHLHFEIHKNGVVKNPANYLN